MKQKTEFMRVEKTKNYSVISNEFIRREDLSWKAKGILTYILTLPDDWVININEIMKHATEGEKAFRSGWKELKDSGYVNRYPVRDKESNKITHWETVIRESVDTKGFEPLTQNVQVQKVQVQKVQVQNDKLQSTYITNNLDKQNTESNKDTMSSSDEHDRIPYSEIVEYLNEKTNSQYRPTLKKTKTLIKARYNDGFILDDFKKVIDVKVAEWLNDSNMNKYLRPETLFGTKFESYLNQKVVNGGTEYNANAKIDEELGF